MPTESESRSITLYARLASDDRIASILDQLRGSGIEDPQISLFSNQPLQAPLATGSRWLVPVAVLAGLAGIVIGVALAGGTALLYPIQTGGKPIVAYPIVGLISYETMMLCAILATVAALVISIRRAAIWNAGIPELEADNEVAVVVRLSGDDPRRHHVRRLLQETQAIEVRTLETA
ncbi:MAG TPA: quinol:electron acceptor oxidoreductase subunit ActD [Nitrospira sp.]|nr:quinol:electron acceptor oxidoreductase subunit ActD [Nitrospira sp.]